MNLTITPFKNLVVLFFLISILSACGGDNSSTPNIQEESPRRVPLLVEDSLPSTRKTLSSVDAMLQYSLLAQEIYLYNSGYQYNEELTCDFGGVTSLQLEDNDSNSGLSSGDVLTVIYRDCDLGVPITRTSGQILYEIIELSPSGFKFLVDTRDIEQFANYWPLGIFQIDYTKNGLFSEIKINTTDALEVLENGELLLSINDLSITKTEDRATAEYTVSANGKVSERVSNLNYSFSQVTPFSGFFSEYPYAGEMLLSASQFDQITITARSTDNTGAYNFKGSTSPETGTADWLFAIDGAFAAVNEKMPLFTHDFNASNLRYVDFIGQPDFDSFGLTDSFKLIFSRPVLEAESQFDDIVFRVPGSSSVFIPASVSIEGAILTLTPLRPFEPGEFYEIPELVVRSLEQQIILPRLPQFQASSEIIPKIRAQNLLFRPNDTPWIDASSSKSDTQDLLTYQWSEITNTGIVFTEPNAARTEFTVNNNITQDIQAMVTVTNSMGYSVTENVIIRYLPVGTDYLFYDSSEDNFVGRGQQLAVTSLDGDFTFKKFEDQRNDIELEVFSDAIYSLRLSAIGDQALSVGIYEDAGPYPFQSLTQPGLSFSVEASGCGADPGRFEVLEFEQTDSGAVTNLSVNFNLRCQPTSPELDGMLRFNSDLPINR